MFFLRVLLLTCALLSVAQCHHTKDKGCTGIEDISISLSGTTNSALCKSFVVGLAGQPAGVELDFTRRHRLHQICMGLNGKIFNVSIRYNVTSAEILKMAVFLMSKANATNEGVGKGTWDYHGAHYPTGSADYVLAFLMFVLISSFVIMFYGIFLFGRDVKKIFHGDAV